MITWNATDINPSDAQAVLFDFDGTLANTKPIIIQIATKVLSDYGMSASDIAAKVNDLIGPPFPEAFSIVFGFSSVEAAEITRRYRAIYTTCGREAWPFFDGMIDLLTDLRRCGKKLAVASSKLQHMTERGVADNNATQLFDAIVGKVDGVTSIKAEAIAHATHALGVPTSATMMVGDRHNDVEGARAAGVACIGVLYGNTGTRSELTDAGAIAVVDTVEELGEVLLGSHSTMHDNGV